MKAGRVLLFVLVLILLEPLVCGFLARRQVMKFMAGSPMGARAVRSYEQGYLSSDMLLVFDGRELLSRTLSAAQQEKWRGVLTSVVFRTTARLYHCPSLKHLNFFCQGQGETRVYAPGDIAKDIDLNAFIGWDGAVHASFRLKGEELAQEALDTAVPGGALAEGLGLDLSMGDLCGSLVVPLKGGRAYFQLRSEGMQFGKSGFEETVVEGGSRAMASGVTAYCLTGTLAKTAGGKVGASDVRMILGGVESNRLNNACLRLNAAVKHEGRTYPLEFKVAVTNCNFRKIADLKRSLGELEENKRQGLNLGMISKLAAVLECGKAFVADRPEAWLAGNMELPEGTGTVTASCQVQDGGLKDWKDILKLGEKAQGGVSLAVPVAAVEAGGSLDALCGGQGIVKAYLEGQAAVSNGCYVLQYRLSDFLLKGRRR